MRFVLLTIGVYRKDTVAGWRKLELAPANRIRRCEPQPLRSNIPFTSPTPARHATGVLAGSHTVQKPFLFTRLAFALVHNGYSRC